MALRRSRGQRDAEGGRTKGFAERIAAATKPEPSGSGEGKVTSVLTPGLTRYQRNTANLPAGAKSLTSEEVTNIVIDLRDEDGADPDVS
jgi:hypothetical protein